MVQIYFRAPSFFLALPFTSHVETVYSQLRARLQDAGIDTELAEHEDPIEDEQQQRAMAKVPLVEPGGAHVEEESAAGQQHEDEDEDVEEEETQRLDAVQALTYRHLLESSAELGDELGNSGSSGGESGAADSSTLPPGMELVEPLGAPSAPPELVATLFAMQVRLVTQCTIGRTAYSGAL